MSVRQFSASQVLLAIRRVFRNDQLVLSILAVVVGLAAGGCIIVFREGYAVVQGFVYGSDAERLFHLTRTFPWWQRLLVPTCGGLVVGLMIRYVMHRDRPSTVADVIAATALRGGRMSITRGLRTALADCVSIGFGSSVGREGPAVHLGASIGGWVAKRLHLTRSLSRSLLGCGVAAAVAASFNAPIAGALFANEVVIGHYALSAFAPVVIASVAGTMVSQFYFGPFPAFEIAEYPLRSFWEFPAFIGLGIAAAVVAILFIRLTTSLQEKTARIPGPIWVRTTIGGVILGGIAVLVPEVLGVGYGVTEAALMATLSLQILLIAGIGKFLATVTCLGFGMSGGVFSPSLVMGAMLGGAYGIVVTQIAPELSSGPGAYTVVGMGAVAAAVLGAPISTAVIIFEMTGNYGLTMAVMLAVVIASVSTKQAIGHSYFTAILAKRGFDVRRGFEMALLKGLTVGDVMSTRDAAVPTSARLQDLRMGLQRSTCGEVFVVDDFNRLVGTVTLADMSEVAFDRDFDDVVRAADVVRIHPPTLAPSDDLETALQVFRRSGEQHIAVVDPANGGVFLGCVHERDAIDAYNRALEDSRREERGG